MVGVVMVMVVVRTGCCGTRSGDCGGRVNGGCGGFHGGGSQSNGSEGCGDSDNSTGGGNYKR